MSELPHLDSTGNAHMVDVADKAITKRTATAAGFLRTSSEVVGLLRGEGMPKGDALAVARIAAIAGTKRTADLIPLCHPLALTKVAVDLRPAPPDAVEIEATVGLTGRTGVEMEALTAVTVAALTVYDMCKALDRGMRIEAVRLARKSGGKSGDWEAA